jgi:hypothetical protein
VPDHFSSFSEIAVCILAVLAASSISGMAGYWIRGRTVTSSGRRYTSSAPQHEQRINRVVLPEPRPVIEQPATLPLETAAPALDAEIERGESAGDVNRPREVTRYTESFASSGDPPFSTALVQDVYENWCRSGIRPDLPDTVFMISLSFARVSRANDLADPIFLFEDHPQIGPFVRFASDAREDDALAYPHPDAAFNMDVHRMLLPNISAEDFRDVSNLAAIRPVPIRRRSDNAWERSS